MEELLLLNKKRFKQLTEKQVAELRKYVKLNIKEFKERMENEPRIKIFVTVLGTKKAFDLEGRFDRISNCDLLEIRMKGKNHNLANIILKETLAKIGDTIQWENEDEPFKGVYTDYVAMVDTDNKEYGVYCKYGQDRIPFKHAKIIKRKK